MAKATLAIASKNYGSWSLRGWLLCKMARLEFDEVMISSDETRAERGRVEGDALRLARGQACEVKCHRLLRR